MTGPDRHPSQATRRRAYGPAVGEPPPVADPRRGGSVIGLIGGMVFIAAYSPALGRTASLTAWVVGVVLVLVALFRHYVRPVALGPLTPPRRAALAVYGICVVGELGLIALGSRFLQSVGHGDLRPALIAAVVGLHFIPFGWAFGERLFRWLGMSLTLLGALGLIAGLSGVPHAAEALAVVAGMVMLTLIAAYANGGFAPGSSAPRPGRGEPLRA
jgi:hypothetical protein